jgi:hypothetical protein
MPLSTIFQLYWFYVEETGVPGENHKPAASQHDTFYNTSSLIHQFAKKWAILVSDWLKIKKILSSETRTRKHNELLLCRNDVWGSCSTCGTRHVTLDKS